MKKVIALLLATVLLLTPMLACAATPRYTYTGSISCNLSFSGSNAICSGSIQPTGDYPVSIVVSLYYLSDSGWTHLRSWYSKATGGSTAAAGGSCAATESGTYKLTVSGNVNNGSETPSKTILRTK